MIVYIHIATDGDFMDSRVCTTAIVPCKPAKGETFFLTEYNIEHLYQQIDAHFYDKNIEDNPYRFVDLDAYIFVHDVMFKPKADGEYELHIELSDTDK